MIISNNLITAVLIVCDDDDHSPVTAAGANQSWKRTFAKFQVLNNLNMKVIVGAFIKLKALCHRGLLSDCEI